jgi:hypothetical protein
MFVLYTCTQACPLFPRGLGFLCKERLLVIFYFAFTYVFALLQLQSKIQKTPCIYYSFSASLRTIPSAPCGFENIFFIERYYNLTPYTYGLSLVYNSLCILNISPYWTGDAASRLWSFLRLGFADCIALHSEGKFACISLIIM